MEAWMEEPRRTFPSLPEVERRRLIPRAEFTGKLGGFMEENGRKWKKRHDKYEENPGFGFKNIHPVFIHITFSKTPVRLMHKLSNSLGGMIIW